MRKLLVAIVVVLGLLVVADRVLAVVAAHAVADKVAEDQQDCAKPGVDIGGFPFLTQAIRGRYDDVRLTTHCQTKGVSLDPVSADLRGVHVSLTSIVHRKVSRVPVDDLTGSATLPYSEINAHLPGQQLSVGAGPNNTITVTGTLSVAGHSVSAHGTGAVSISDGQLHIAVTSVSTPVGSVDPGGAFSASLPLPSLPFHLTGASVSGSSAGVVITGHAHNVVLNQ